MARRKPSVSKSGGVVVVQTPSPPAPARRRSSGPPAKRKKSGGRRRAGGGTAYSLKSRMTGSAMGGFGVGFIEKHWGASLPTLPFVGRKGAIALACYFLAPKHKMIGDIGVAAAAISGYELGKLGVISGEDDDEVIAPQM